MSRTTHTFVANITSLLLLLHGIGCIEVDFVDETCGFVSNGNYFEWANGVCFSACCWDTTPAWESVLQYNPVNCTQSHPAGTLPIKFNPVAVVPDSQNNVSSDEWLHNRTRTNQKHHTHHTHTSHAHTTHMQYSCSQACYHLGSLCCSKRVWRASWPCSVYSRSNKSTHCINL